MTIQLSFFESYEEQIQTENRFLKSEMKRVAEKSEKTHAMSDKVRKKLFAENSELKKRMSELEYRLEAIERGLCYAGK